VEQVEQVEQFSGAVEWSRWSSLVEQVEQFSGAGGAV
jgi:hypothetical protein